MAGVFQSLGGCSECICGSSVLRGQHIEKQPIRMTKESLQEVRVYIYWKLQFMKVLFCLLVTTKTLNSAEVDSGLKCYEWAVWSREDTNGWALVSLLLSLTLPWCTEIHTYHSMDLQHQRTKSVIRFSGVHCIDFVLLEPEMCISVYLLKLKVLRQSWVRLRALLFSVVFTAVVIYRIFLCELWFKHVSKARASKIVRK